MKNIFFWLLVSTNFIFLFTVQKISGVNKYLSAALRECEMVAQLGVGDLAASFQAVDFDQNIHTLNFVGSDHFSLVQFIQPNCGGCLMQVQEFWPRLAVDSNLNHVSHYLVSLASFEETVSKIPEDLRVGKVLITQDPSVKKAYGLSKVPTTMLISPDGKVEWMFSERMTEKTYHDLLAIIGH